MGYLLVYVLATYLVVRWNRGILPVIAALAIILGIFAAVSAPGWFDRDAAGFAQPAVDADVLGLVCIVLAVVQLVLLVIAMIGFRQAWNVEVERRSTAARSRRRRRTAGRRCPPSGRALRSADPGPGGGTADAGLSKALSERTCGFESRPGHLGVSCLATARRRRRMAGRATR